MYCILENNGVKKEGVVDKSTIVNFIHTYRIKCTQEGRMVFRGGLNIIIIIIIY